MSHARTHSRRSHWLKMESHLVPCPKCGTLRFPHHVCPNCGTYRGEEVLEMEKEKKTE